MSIFSKNRVLFPTDFSELASIAQEKTLHEDLVLTIYPTEKSF